MPYREADQLNTYLFHEGTSISAYEYMGAHAVTRDGTAGYMYRVRGPRAQGGRGVGGCGGGARAWGASPGTLARE